MKRPAKPASADASKSAGASATADRSSAPDAPGAVRSSGPATDAGKRKGAPSRRAIPADILDRLNAGTLETANLAEGLAIDLARLVATTLPDIGPEALRAVAALSSLGITRRMEATARILLERLGATAIPDLGAHASDTVRGLACYMIGAVPDMAPAERLAAVRPLADDPHFGVREWAWIAVRPYIIEEIEEWLKELNAFTALTSDRLRRFACEATRPRGVWCAHIPALRRDPALGLPILDALRDDPSDYVRKSVGNWLNDAGKDHPDWVRRVCAGWEKETDSPANRAIRTRALRNLGDRRQSDRGQAKH